MKKHLSLIIFLTLYFFVIAFKLVNHPTPFYDWDESINVQVSKEIIKNKSLVPLWQGKAWLDKPPLPFLFFGIIMKLTPFLQPEISLRLTSLFLSIVALVFVYLIYLKVETSRRDVSTGIIAFLSVVITAFTPIFLQRSQILNLDVFLLIGWLGYLLFVQNFWLSLFFLAVGVLTKSLLGFYPVAILILYYSYLLFSQKIKLIEYKKIFLKLSSHLAILAIWYIVMLLIFKEQFWQQHIIETHFRRITASLESHFGQRTYYLDLISEQLGIFFWISVLGLVLVILERLKGAIESSTKIISSLQKSFLLQDDKLLYGLFLFPWFVFLNLTKTKIFWYLYPAIPQFAFFSVYPLTLLMRHSGKRVERAHPESLFRFWSRFAPQNDVGKTISYLLSLILILFIFHQNFIKTNFFATFYSKPEDYYQLALYAKDRCDSLSVLVGKETREATKTLEDLGLTITSTKQWGDHPSIVYYFGKKVNFIYDKNLLSRKLVSFSKNECLAIRKDDLNIIKENKTYKPINDFNSFYLFKR